MALPPTDTTNDAFVREVDEEFRRDQLLGIWKKWGRWIIGAIVGGLLLFGGFLYVRGLSDSAAGSQGRRYDAAMRNLAENQTAQANPELRKLATDANPGYRAMARFAEAELLLAGKDAKGAAARYAEIAADAKLPQPFRDRAVVQQTLIEFDGLKPEVVIDRLKALAVTDSTWFGSAGEMVAAAYLKQGKRDLAGKLYGQIAQSKGFVPDSIRQRAVQMAGVLGVDAIDQSEEKKAK
ncbi:MAG: tetratricopeptide repeat protein [Pseudomonadota bacterium]